MDENGEQNTTQRTRNRIAEFAIDLVVAVAGGILTHLLVGLLTHLNLQSPMFVSGLAIIVVLCLLIAFGIKFKRKSAFWYMATGALVLAGVLLWMTVVRVPNVVGMSLTEAKASVANAGLAFEEIEMVKGGSKDVMLQRPDGGTRLFRGSHVKLYFGQNPTVVITNLKNGDRVSSHRANIEGMSHGVFGSSDFHIRVLIRPQDNHVWVQDAPELDPMGKFSILAYFGTPELGRDETFRVQAIVTTEPLRAGEFGTTIPKYVTCSPVVQVTRGR